MGHFGGMLSGIILSYVMGLKHKQLVIGVIAVIAIYGAGCAAFFTLRHPLK